MRLPAELGIPLASAVRVRLELSEGEREMEAKIEMTTCFFSDA